MVAELTRQPVAVIIASPTPAALAAKAAATTVPIATDDPVKLDLVASLAIPGGNATGVNIYNAELGLSAERLLRELLPVAHADAIDGDWRRSDSKRMAIRGPAIVTPSSQQTSGDYTRQHFSCVIPSGEPGADATISIQLRRSPMQFAGACR